MKSEIIQLSSNNTVTFHIGKDARDNTNIVKNGNCDDLWFHADEYSSCHVVASMPNNCTKKEKRQIIKAGALLCKQNTNKLRSERDVSIVYTKIKNITTTSTPGLVHHINGQIIRI